MTFVLQPGGESCEVSVCVVCPGVLCPPLLALCREQERSDQAEEHGEQHHQRQHVCSLGEVGRGRDTLQSVTERGGGGGTHCSQS